MAWTALLFFLLTYCPGSLSQYTLTQPSSESVSLRDTVKLSCTVSSGYSHGAVYWLQQKGGNSPRYLLWYETDSKNHQGSGVPSRFSGSKDTSNKIGYLTITSVQAEDEADYYCAAHTNNVWVFGGGTQLTVLGQPKASPTVHLFPPSPEEITSKSKATLVCLMDGFYPGSVQVTWKADGTTMSSGVETTTPSKQSDNKYMASSYLSLSASAWKSHETYTCQVTHDGKSIEKTLKRSECS